MEDSEEIKERIINNQTFRKNITSESLYWFAHTYFPHYIKYPTAEFQKEIIELLQDFDKRFIEILAFRGSAKSTLAMLFFPLWAVISGKARFPVLFSDTFLQIKQHIYNLKSEAESNKLLVRDWGPFEGKEQWTTTDIVFPKYGARIAARSTRQKVRGIRHKQYRPDIACCDDIESIEDVRTKEQRDKDERWFLGEVLPALDRDARVILIGNLLHSDALMARVANQIKEGSRRGTLVNFPFLDKKGKPLWKEKFTTEESIKEEMGKYGGKHGRTWQREFLLKIVPEEGQEVKDEWIRYYDELPERNPDAQGTGVDLAISKRETANYTAMVAGKLYNTEKGPRIYIMPYIVNKRLSGAETNEEAKAVSLKLGNGSLTTLWVEDVAYQRRAVEEMQRIGLPAEGIKSTTDKRARLKTVATYIENGMVFFPKKGCEDLIIQITGFGVEAHDDLVDAFCFCVTGLMTEAANAPEITII